MSIEALGSFRREIGSGRAQPARYEGWEVRRSPTLMPRAAAPGSIPMRVRPGARESRTSQGTTIFRSDASFESGRRGEGGVRPISRQPVRGPATAVPRSTPKLSTLQARFVPARARKASRAPQGPLPPGIAFAVPKAPRLSVGRCPGAGTHSRLRRYPAGPKCIPSHHPMGHLPARVLRHGDENPRRPAGVAARAQERRREQPSSTSQ